MDIIALFSPYLPSFLGEGQNPRRNVSASLKNKTHDDFLSFEELFLVGGVHPALVSVKLWTGDGFPAVQSPFLGIAAHSPCWVGLRVGAETAEVSPLLLGAQGSSPSAWGQVSQDSRAWASLVMRIVLIHSLGNSTLENKAMLQNIFIPWSHTIKLLINLM